MNAVIKAASSSEVVEQLIEQFQLRPPFVDVTFGRGRFWNPERLKDVVGFDLFSDEAPIRASWDALPLANHSASTVFYDPPHLPTTGPNSAWKERGYGIAEWTYRDGFAPGPHESFFKEAARVITQDGYVIAKTADMINWNKPYWLTLTVIDAAKAQGFELFDWVISFRRSPLVNRQRQANNWHAKKHHAHWLVFTPPGAKVSRHA